MQLAPPTTPSFPLGVFFLQRLPWSRTTFKPNGNDKEGFFLQNFHETVTYSSIFLTVSEQKFVIL